MSEETKKEQARAEENGGKPFERAPGEHRSHRGSRGGRRSKRGRGDKGRNVMHERSARNKPEENLSEQIAEAAFDQVEAMDNRAAEKQAERSVGKQEPDGAARSRRGARSRNNGNNRQRQADEHRVQSSEDVPFFVDEPAAAETVLPPIACEADMPFPEEHTEPSSPAEVENPIEVVGVRFKTAGKVYYFAPGDLQVTKNSFVIVETARGTEFGEVAAPNRIVDASRIIPPLRPVLRVATEEDIAHNAENKCKEREAFQICQEKIAEHGLEMKLVDVEYTFDNNKLLFYFTSEGRVDFRNLVKHLASIFRTRIELRQIGIRDEAKLMGGLGICGRPLCCASFLSDFVQVSIKMAKEQNLSLNSSKISGVCGRLMCCLRYESETYEEELLRSPAIDSLVRTPDGTGVVTEVNPLAGTVRVRFPENTPPPKLYPRDEVKVIEKAGKGGRPDEIHEDA